MKKYLAIVVMTLMLSGCVTTSANTFDAEKRLNEMNIEESRFDNAFFQVYKGDLRQWVSKNVTEVENNFTMEEGKWVKTESKSMDIYGNGWESFKPFNEYSSARLTFYFEGGKVYNVVKE